MVNDFLHLELFGNPRCLRIPNVEHRGAHETDRRVAEMMAYQQWRQVTHERRLSLVFSATVPPTTARATYTRFCSAQKEARRELLACRVEDGNT